jgi:hypothetical protein
MMYRVKNEVNSDNEDVEKNHVLSNKLNELLYLFVIGWLL